MTIYTDRGNFGGFEDILLDMQHDGYDTITVTDTTHIAGQIHLGNMGVLTIDDVKQVIEELKKDVL